MSVALWSPSLTLSAWSLAPVRFAISFGPSVGAFVLKETWPAWTAAAREKATPMAREHARSGAAAAAIGVNFIIFIFVRSITAPACGAEAQGQRTPTPCGPAKAGEGRQSSASKYFTVMI